LDLPHQTLFSVSASRTMNLSCAERPVCARFDDQRPVGAQLALAAGDRGFDQSCGHQIPVEIGARLDPLR
jgi:hypothetical protein